MSKKLNFVPVVDIDSKPLMPTNPKRARQMVESRKATPFWNRGVWCIRLNVDPSERNLQTVVAGVDPGSKKEAYTVKSESHTYLNIQCDAITDVKDKMEARRNARRSRRQRNTPCRKNKLNRNCSPFPPSTKARWDLKLRILKWLKRIYPISNVIVEDISAESRKGSRKWNASFSPLQIGKKWFYDQVKDLGVKLHLRKGYETHKLRQDHGLSKSKKKLSEAFDAHCVDSWVLANEIVGGHVKPDNERMLLIKPLRWARRQLHVFNPITGGIRKNYGSTRSMGLTRGSLVKHPKYGLAIVGGTSKNRISLHDRLTNKRLTQSARSQDCVFIAYISWLGFPSGTGIVSSPA